MLESQIERRLGTLVRRAGCMYLKVGHDGLPDRLIVFPGGAVVWAELKTDDGALTKLQESRIRDLERHGQTVAVVRGGGGVDEFVQRFFLSGEAR